MTLPALLSIPEPTRGLHSTLMTAAMPMGGARTIVVLGGEAEGSSRPVLCDMLCQLVALQVGDVVIDLGQVTVIDLAAVRAVAMGCQLLNGQGRRLTFRSPSTLAARMLDRFGMADLIESSLDAPHERHRLDASCSGSRPGLCSRPRGSATPERVPA